MKLRDDQLDALRRARDRPAPWELAGRMVEDLEDLGMLDRKDPRLEDHLEELRRREPRAGADRELALRALVARQIETAHRCGIRSELLVLYVAGFGIRHGLDWSEGKAAAAILESRDLDEAAKVTKLRKALSCP